MKYGYRVFAVELHQGRHQTRQPFHAAQWIEKDEKGKKLGGAVQMNYLDHLVADVTAKTGERNDFGNQSADDDSGADGAKVAIRFIKAERKNDLVKIFCEQGPHNLDGTLLLDDGDISLANKPTLHPYRAALYAPEGTSRGLIAVEVRGRSCPVDPVLRGLRMISEEDWRLRDLGNLAGEAAMMAYLRNAEIRETVFDKWTYDKSGAREVKDLHMAVKPSGDAVRGNLLEWAQSYFGFQRAERTAELEADAEAQPKPPMKRDEKKAATARRRAEEKAEKIRRRESAAERSRIAASELRRAVFVSRSETVDVDFDEVAVKTELGDDVRTIKPNTDFGKFTYQLGRSQPSESTFFAKVLATMEGLHREVVDLPLAD
ncbi:hypothetical protein ACTHQY_09110 [Rhodococcoides corynebacterioides]|uniref:hypothetical protein n=1 Tax=Rhodococcoides corynebacterioides TaxID=53972 RepID=UPI003F7D1672